MTGLNVFVCLLPCTLLLQLWEGAFVKIAEGSIWRWLSWMLCRDIALSSWHLLGVAQHLRECLPGSCFLQQMSHSAGGGSRPIWAGCEGSFGSPPPPFLHRAHPCILCRCSPLALTKTSSLDCKCSGQVPQDLYMPFWGSSNRLGKSKRGRQEEDSQLARACCDHASAIQSRSLLAFLGYELRRFST